MLTNDKHGFASLTGGYVNVRKERKEVLQVVVGTANNSKWQCNASTNSSNSPLSVKNDTKPLSTFSSKIATDMPLYEPPGVLLLLIYCQGYWSFSLACLYDMYCLD